MIFSKGAILLIVILVAMSMFVASLLNIIATDHNFFPENKSEGENYTNYLGGKYGQITDKPHNLIWFLQISDIHISIFRDPGRITQFQQFCDSTVKKINPAVVLATGDLTDAKAKDNLGSSQVKTEWVYYYNIIKESGIIDKTIWLDIRGNHDNFNIRSLNAEENYFRNYSVQGAANSKSYLHVLKKNGLDIAFLGLDACPDPGLRRPFNFIGILDTQEQLNVQRLKSDAAAKADHIIWFGHYPTSCILCVEKDSQILDIRNVIGNNKATQVYVCGHLHSMGGLVTKMYTKHKAGFLELELGDWKDNRMFRIAAIDHGLFSFVDQRHNTWPIVLVTNPKHAQYMLPGHEPLQLIPYSTHIRILAFSDVKVTSVKISFDKVSWMECRSVEKPLYVCKWLPHLFSNGLHKLYVTATDENDKQTSIEHPFSLDGSTIKFEIIPRILLMLDAGCVFQLVFAVLLLINVFLLVVMRVKRRLPKYHWKSTPRIIKQVWLLSKVDRIFYPIVLFAIYIALGPWAIGELIDGHVGAIFAWGILIRGTFLPEPFTYMYGGVQMMFVQIPLIFVLAYCLETRLFCHNIRGVTLLIRNLPFIFILTIQLLLAYFFWLEYGTMAVLFGPLRTWSIAFNSILWYKTLTLPPDICRYLTRLNEIPS